MGKSKNRPLRQTTIDKNGFAYDMKPRKSKVSEDIINDIKQGTYDLNYYIDRYTSSYYQSPSKLKSIITEIRELQTKDIKTCSTWKAPEPTYEWGNEWYKAMMWMKCFIRPKEPTINRRKHLFVCGMTGTGKSSRLLNPLKHDLYGWEIAKDPIQNNPYYNDYDFIYCDEYNMPYKDIPFLNELTTPVIPGTRSRIRQPGGHFMDKYDYPPVIIISNKTMKELYSEHIGTEVFEALHSRFYHIYIDQRGNPFGIDDLDNVQQLLFDDLMQYDK